MSRTVKALGTFGVLAMLAFLVLALTGAAHAQEPIQIEGWELAVLEADPDEDRYADVVEVTLEVSTVADEAASAWRGTLVVVDPFDEELFRVEVTAGKGGIPAEGTGEAVFTFEDNQFIDGEPYDHLTSYDPENLTLELVDVQVVG